MAVRTLGDVLQQSQRLRVTEREWVALVQAVAKRDVAALHALFDRARDLVFTLALRITQDRSNAEEVTLDVFHDVWLRASKYDAANGTVLGWIMNMARSRSLDRVRFEQRKKRTPPAKAAPVVSYVDMGPTLRALRSHLARLKPEEREAIDHAFVLGLTHAEVAERLGQPIGTIKSRIRAALHKLREAMEEGADR